MDQKNVEQMNYSEFVGLVGERNRPSGGLKTVHAVVKNAFLNPPKKILEIGSNTGFTSVNISLLTGCEVVGIDVHDASIQEAKEYAAHQGVSEKVSFMKADALNLPFENNSFDLVWCSNVTSFISDKDKAISEYLRVLKVGGNIALIPIYYIDEPPKEIVQKVSDAIGARVTVSSKAGWKLLFEKTAAENSCAIELLYEEDCRYLNVQGSIGSYVSLLMKKESVLCHSTEDQEKIRRRAEYFYGLFNENLQYAGYSILLYQKRTIKDEMELFLTERV